MEDKALKIIETYGVYNQIKHLGGELIELCNAIYTNDHDNIAEELADNMAILKTIQYYYGIDDKVITDIIEEKYNRESDRIDGRISK